MTEVNSEQLIQLQGSGKKILLDLYGTWCGPCKQLIPKLEKIEKEHDNVEFVKMDVDLNKDFATNLGIRSIPTVMIFNGEELIDKTTGIQPNEHYKEILDKL